MKAGFKLDLEIDGLYEHIFFCFCDCRRMAINHMTKEYILELCCDSQYIYSEAPSNIAIDEKSVVD